MVWLLLLSLLACGNGGGVDLDGDGYNSKVDCNDLSTVAHPGGKEICDGIDNDCDGVIDGNTALDRLTWYQDADGDGYGLEGYTLIACEQPAGYSDTSGDCDDANAAIYPENGCDQATGTDTDPDEAPDRDGPWGGAISVELASEGWGVSDTCEGDVTMNVDEAGDPEVRGSATCTFYGVLSDIGSLELRFDGTVYDNATAGGRLWVDDVEDWWYGTFVAARSMDGTFDGESEIGGTVATFVGEFTVTPDVVGR